jgi:hypothetical protein
VLPGLEALRETCRIFGVDATGARLLHHRSNAVYLVIDAGAVAAIERLAASRSALTIRQ